MNKQDFYLIGVVIFIFVCLISFMKITENKNKLNALVYYEDKEVLKIDLTKKEQEYTVKGANGDVKITAGDGKVKVEDEDSPLHLCSKQGYISKSYETIVCLPNKIVIKLESDDEIDTIVK